MENQEFDRILREKLSGLKPEYDPSSWASLAARMDAGSPPLREEDLDQAVFEKLHDFRPAQPPKGWTALAKRLAAEQLRPQLIQAKILEAALLFVLLVFLADVLLPGTPYRPGLADTASREPSAPVRPEGHTSPLPPAVRPSAPNSAPKAAAPVFAGREDRPQAKELPGLPGLFLSELTLPPRPLPLRAPRLYAEASPLLPSLNMHRPGQALPPDIQPLPTARRPHPLIVSIYGNFNYNRIFTPAGTEGTTGAPSVKRYEPSYGGGITLGLGLGRWEIGGGMAFNAYSYRPRQVVYLEGSLREGLYGLGIKDIELNTLSVPLYARYDLLRHKQWRLFAQGGLQLEVAFEASYFLADASAFLHDPALAGRPPRENPGNPRSTQEIVNKELTEGWFEGGTFQDNAFVTGHLGLGVEYYPSPDWSLFVQPSYRPYLFAFDGGIGPDRDRISSFSILTGLRIPLKQ
jgi:hypothetical protein